MANSRFYLNFKISTLLESSAFRLIQRKHQDSTLVKDSRDKMKTKTFIEDILQDLRKTCLMKFIYFGEILLKF